MRSTSLVKSNSDDPTVNLSLTDSSSSESNHDYPDVWSLAQKNEFCEKYDWLCFKDQKLGCKVCKKIPVNFERKKKRVFDQASKEWLNCEITYSGDTWEQKLLSVRKKFYRHKESEFHSKAVKIVEESEHKTIETIVLKNISTSKAIKVKYFVRFIKLC